jgi:hypothetical protein
MKSKYICVGSFAYFADCFDTRVPQHRQDTRWPFNLLDFRVVRKVWGRIEQQVPTSPSPSARAQPGGGWLRSGIRHERLPKRQGWQPWPAQAERGLSRYRFCQQVALWISCVQFLIAWS